MKFSKWRGNDNRSLGIAVKKKEDSTQNLGIYNRFNFSP